MNYAKLYIPMDELQSRIVSDIANFILWLISPISVYQDLDPIKISKSIRSVRMKHSIILSAVQHFKVGNIMIV